MATGFLVASAAVKVGGAVKSKKAAKRQSAEERRLADENIALERAETEESIKRTQESQRLTLGLAKAQTAASGFSVGSSLDKYIGAMEGTFESDIDWMRTSGASREAIAEREASARQKASNSAASGQFVSSIGGALGTASGVAGSYSKYKWGF